MKKFTLFILLSLSLNAINVTGKGLAGVASVMKNQTSLSFVENIGQVTDQNQNQRHDIQFCVAATPGLNIFIGDGAIHYQFSKRDSISIQTKTNNQDNVAIKLRNPKNHFSDNFTYSMYRMDVELVGANKNAEVITEEKQNYYENYFTTGTGEKGATAHAYNKITYKNIYPNVDWVLYISNGQLKHEFVVRNGGKVSDIQIKYGGAKDLKINADGSLTATTPQGTITEQTPKSYQAKGEVVKSSFILNNDILSYKTHNYSGMLVIDPALQWATYYGGAGDGGKGVATDNSGNVYMIGTTGSTSGIATSGAYETTLSGSGSIGAAFLAKFNGAGVRQWATYYGGTDTDGTGTGGYSVATDVSGNVYITGLTFSASGIATTGVYQPTYGGGYGDAFLAKFSSSGSIQWATYYGGTSSYADQYGCGVATDGSGNVYITGLTSSTSGIATAGAYQTIYGGDNDAFIAKFSNSGTMQWATYYGGSGDDQGMGIAIDSTWNVFITGETTSTSGIATSGAYQTTFGGVFLAKFFINCTTPTGGTINGSSTICAGSVIALTDTSSSGAWSAINGNATVGSSGVVTGVTAGYDSIKYTVTNSCFIATTTKAITINPLPATISGTVNFCVGSSIYLTDITTPGIWSSSNASVASIGTGSGFVSGINAGTSIISYTLPTGCAKSITLTINATPAVILGITNVCSGHTVTLSDITPGGTWVCSSSGTASIGSTTGIVTGGASGTATITYELPTGCITTSSVTVNPLPNAGAINGLSMVCVSSSISLTDTATGGLWGASNGKAFVSSVGVVLGVSGGVDTINYSVTNSCGTSSATKVVTINPAPSAGIITGLDTVCVSSSITLADTVAGGTWSASNGNAFVSSTGVVLGVTVGLDDITYTIINTCGTGTIEKNIQVITCSTGLSKIPTPTEEITIYPNPTQDNITVTSSTPINSIVISNLIGQNVYSGSFNTNSVAVSLQQVPGGVYVVKINGNKVYKIVKD